MSEDLLVLSDSIYANASERTHAPHSHRSSVRKTGLAASYLPVCAMGFVCPLDRKHTTARQSIYTHEKARGRNPYFEVASLDL